MAGLKKEDLKLLKLLKSLIKNVTKNIEAYRFGKAAEFLYQFAWHEFADVYIEKSKERIKNGDMVVLSILHHVYLNLLKLLHPFIPFVTEEVWGQLKYGNKPLIIEDWPK